MTYPGALAWMLACPLGAYADAWDQGGGCGGETAALTNSEAPIAVRARVYCITLLRDIVQTLALLV